MLILGQRKYYKSNSWIVLALVLASRGITKKEALITARIDMDRSVEIARFIWAYTESTPSCRNTTPSSNNYYELTSFIVRGCKSSLSVLDREPFIFPTAPYST